VRTEKGPPQRVLLYMGSKIDLPEEQYKLLAAYIQDMIQGEQVFIPYPEKVDVNGNLKVTPFGHVMTLALLVYSIAQRMLRRYLSVHEQTLPNQINQMPQPILQVFFLI